MEQRSYTLYADLANEASVPARGIHSQTVAKAGGVEVILFAMAAGEQLSEHAAARPAIIHVLAGEGDLVVGGDPYPFRSGSWLRMDARTPHAITAENGVVFALYLLPGETARD